MDVAEQIRAQIRAHPFELVAAAALFGAWVGFTPPREKKRGKIGEAIVAGAGALVLRLVREAAFRQLGAIAMRWWDEMHEPPRDTDVHYDVQT